MCLIKKSLSFLYCPCKDLKEERKLINHLILLLLWQFQCAHNTPVILTALGCIIYLCISAVVRNSRCIRWIQKDLFWMLFITDIEMHKWHTNRHMGGIYKQLFCHGNTHWFTWETPGSNVSIVSLKTHTETKCWLVTESHGDRCFE